MLEKALESRWEHCVGLTHARWAAMSVYLSPDCFTRKMQDSNVPRPHPPRSQLKMRQSSRVGYFYRPSCHAAAWNRDMIVCGVLMDVLRQGERAALSRSIFSPASLRGAPVYPVYRPCKIGDSDASRARAGRVRCSYGPSVKIPSPRALELLPSPSVACEN
ncbi:hypothetical protein SCP_1002360 [Sparassis crispa]|uniref:Uncharacterized protein n=1 Tax=Sparassis crispa TaxID=139825 RepID=A0A401GXT4_9APHY|nr:hypothetical protein SCP_1002360 [Sparassis crispa]GBE86990.1 hypothetical protein SCP_1002360 [Sparassis crispa]